MTGIKKDNIKVKLSYEYCRMKGKEEDIIKIEHPKPFNLSLLI